MHPEAYEFVKQALERDPLPDSAAVLEIGSRIVNGSVRPLLPDAIHVGLDIRPGPGADIVSDCADYDGVQTFDAVISTETLEHMAEPEAAIRCAWRALKPGGLLILTAAAPEREPHGNDGGAVLEGEHYKPISPAALEQMLDGWVGVRISHHPERGDVYATARTPKRQRREQE
jgi:SAM-dependent methyltransferase